MRAVNGKQTALAREGERADWTTASNRDIIAIKIPIEI